MKEYKVINAHEIKKTTRIYAVTASIVLLILAIFIQSLYTGVVGLIMFMAVIYKKEIMFNEDGYLTTYDFIFFKHRDLWRYDQISDLHQESAPNRKYVGLLVQKDMVFKRAILPADVVDQVISLAKSKNPKIHVDHVE